MYLQDDIFLSISHNSIIRDWNAELDEGRIGGRRSRIDTYHTNYYDASYGYYFWSYIFDAYKTIKGMNSVKLVILDLDDTLWRGVAGEVTSLTNWEKREGWPMGFVEALLFYKSRGGLLAICSKNDEEVALQQMRDVWLEDLTILDFTSIKINRKSKVDNIREILSEINVLPENVVFVDDNPREISEVMMSFPGLRCISGDHFDWRRVILRSPEMQVPVITEESGRRTELIRTKIEREVKLNSVSREDWLRSLGLELSVYSLNNVASRDFERCFELLNRTNQFNTNGKRWTIGEVKEFFSSGGEIVYISLRDNAADNGVVGITLIKPLKIVQAVLSCRVFGLGAELGMGYFAVSGAMASRKDERELVGADFIETGKNFTCMNYFQSMGFSERDGKLETNSLPVIPDWISVRDCRGEFEPATHGFYGYYEPNEWAIMTEVGYLKANTLCSEGRSGFLMYGPYLDLESGKYEAKIKGKFSFSDGSSFVDICTRFGANIIEKKCWVRMTRVTKLCACSVSAKDLSWWK